MIRKREDWIDFIKGIAILSVVLGHVLLGYTENNAFPSDNSWMVMLMKWIYSWHMPLFFALSGYTFSLSIIKNNKFDSKKCKKQCINILLIYILFSVILGIFKIILSSYVDNPMTIKEFIIGLFFPNTLMWYLWVLMFYYLFFLGFRKWNSWKVLFIIGIITLMFGRSIEVKYNIRLCFRNLLCCFIFFCIGILFYNYGELINKKNILKLTWVFGCIFCVTSIIYCFYLNLNTEKNVLVIAILETIISLSLIITIFNNSNILEKVNRNNVIVRLGTASLVIYLIHTYLVTAIKVVIIRSGFRLGALAVVITWVLPIIVSFCVYLISQRIKLVGYCFKPIIIFEKKEIWK